ncbi:unnamed protein product [Pseudo-nitzschia multistriata]|uniref:Uncharacterized protein n=1 Tax=Pseudo-nitzschia multistriata TaxID=183589 RepID=A0A448Z3L9_9STRA|nr:unnamed protein product [Pseudo-nitzschia multistriata]
MRQPTTMQQRWDHRTTLACRLRVVFFFLTVLGAAVIVSEYQRQEQRALLFHGVEISKGSISPREDWLLDQPIVRTPRTEGKKPSEILFGGVTTTIKNISTNATTSIESGIAEKASQGATSLRTPSANKTISKKEMITKLSQGKALPTNFQARRMPLEQMPNHQNEMVSASLVKNFSEPPTENNTAVVLVAMGKVSENWMVERCVRSIRVGGKFGGTIVVITDGDGYARYSETLLGNTVAAANASTATNRIGRHIDSKQRQIIVMENREEDRTPKTKDGTDVKHYKKRVNMYYKRYKTLVLKYIEQAFEYAYTHDKTDHSNRVLPKHALYLDVDNIVTRPLSGFFEDYYDSVRLQLVNSIQQQGAINTSSKNTFDNETTETVESSGEFSFWSFWRDPHIRTKKATEHLWQSGQIMLSTEHSSQCLDAWRYEMDHTPHNMDQAVLFQMYAKNSTNKFCRFFELPSGGSKEQESDGSDSNPSKNSKPKNRHFQLLSLELAGGIHRSDYPTIVHVTRSRLERFDKKSHFRFLENSLYLNGNASSENEPNPRQSTGTDIDPHTIDSGMTLKGNGVTWKKIIDSFVEVDLRQKRKDKRRKKREHNKRKQENLDHRKENTNKEKKRRRKKKKH